MVIQGCSVSTESEITPLLLSKSHLQIIYVLLLLNVLLIVLKVLLVVDFADSII